MPLLTKTGLDPLNIKKNVIKQKEPDIKIAKRADLKLVLSTIFAVLSTLLLIYVVYTISFKKESIFVEKFLFPQVNIKGEMDLAETRDIIKEGELIQIEKDLLNNKRLQELKLYGEVPVKVDQVGNPNPFAPFGSSFGIIVPEKTETPIPKEEPIVPIEKPLPVIN